jgi:predicted PhzF superfamily epimerase YddE/YHI9
MINELVLSNAAFERIVEYAEVAGISPEQAASEAIMKWMDSTGDDVMVTIQRRRKARAARPKLALVWNAAIA